MKIVLLEIFDLPPSLVQHRGMQHDQADVHADLIVIGFLRGRCGLTAGGRRSRPRGVRTGLGRGSPQQERDSYQHWYEPATPEVYPDLTALERSIRCERTLG